MMRDAPASPKTGRQLVHVAMGAAGAAAAVSPPSKRRCSPARRCRLQRSTRFPGSPGVAFRPVESRRRRSGITLYPLAPAAAPCPARSPRHRRGCLGHPGVRRRHGDHRRTAYPAARASRGTAGEPSPEARRSSCSAAPPVPSSAGGARARRSAAYPWFSIWMPLLAAAMAAAAVETIPIRLDDNISVPATAAAVLWCTSLVSEELVATRFGHAAWRSCRSPLAANVAVAGAGYWPGTVTLGGAVCGAAIGIVIVADRRMGRLGTAVWPHSYSP